MEQALEIKAKFSKGDKLFALEERHDGKPQCLVPVRVDGVSEIRILGTDLQQINYAVSSINTGLCFKARENNLYTIDEMGRFLK